MNRNSDYDSSDLRLTGKAKYDCSHIKLEEKSKVPDQISVNSLKPIDPDKNTRLSMLGSLQTNPMLSDYERLERAYYYGYMARGQTNESPEPNGSFAKLKNIVRKRWRTILIVAILTTAFNWFAPFYTYNHTASGGWSRINRLSGHVQFYHPGYGWQ